MKESLEMLEQLHLRFDIRDFGGQFKDGFHPIVRGVKDGGVSTGRFQEVFNKKT